MKVVVVGSGIGGVSSAYHLQRDGHEVIICEKEKRLGGHTYQVDIDGEKVDLGFMMYGDSNPNIKAWFKSLKLTKEDGTTDKRIPMTMSVTSDIKGDLQFSSRMPFTCVKDLFNGKLWSIITDIYKFTVDLLQMPVKEKITTKEWEQEGHYSPAFFRHYFLPFVAILWTIPKKDVMELPASQFLRCLKTHSNSLYIPLWQVILGALGRRVDRPKHLWWYLGSRYHAPFLQEFEKKGGVVKYDSAVKEVGQGGKYVLLENGDKIECDHVVLAAHADESVKMLPWSEKLSELKRYYFHNSMMYVHRDPHFLPKQRKAWASWNVRITEDDDYIMTYWMNRIQRLQSDKDVFVTITPFDFEGRKPDEDKIIMKFPWDHPRLLADCLPQEEVLDEPGITLAGAWLGRGFHEDGFVSGRRAAAIVNDPKQVKTPLYEDEGNIPVPPVPPFGVPMSIKAASASIVAVMAYGAYAFISSHL